MINPTGLAPHARVRTLCYKIKSSAAVVAGNLVYITGYDAANDAFVVAKADADSEASLADFVVLETIAQDKFGWAASEGVVENLNTSAAAAVGDPVYLSATAGGWTVTKPTADGVKVQIVGRVMVDSATVGKIRFFPGKRVMYAPDTVLTVVADPTWAAVNAGTGLAILLPALTGIQYRVVGGFLVGDTTFDTEFVLQDTSAAVIVSGTPNQTTGLLSPLLVAGYTATNLGVWLTAGRGVKIVSAEATGGTNLRVCLQYNIR